MAPVVSLPHRSIGGHRPTSVGNDDHPMRRMTRRAAGLDERPWDADARREVAELFDSLAPEWHTRLRPERTAMVADAFERGLDPLLLRAPQPSEPGSIGPGLAVEVGSGTGAYTGFLASRFETVLAVELAIEMLHLAPPGVGHRLLADGAELPVRDGSAACICAINAFLFPDEVERALCVGGTFMWVNVSGPDTPIHLGTAEVVSALPFEVDGFEGTAGVGTWCVLRRVS